MSRNGHGDGKARYSDINFDLIHAESRFKTGDDPRPAVLAALRGIIDHFGPSDTDAEWTGGEDRV